MGVIDLTNQKLLALTNVSDGWGVGLRLIKRLRESGIQTALDLAQSDPDQIHSRFSMVLARTVRELQWKTLLRALDRPTRTTTDYVLPVVLPESHRPQLTARSFGQAYRQCLSASATPIDGSRQYGICIRTSPFSGDFYYSKGISENLPDTSLLLNWVDLLYGALYSRTPRQASC